MKGEIFKTVGKRPGGFKVFWGPPRAPGWPETGSANNVGQFRGRQSNPCLGGPFRGHFSFLKVTPLSKANVYVHVVCFSIRNGLSRRGNSLLEKMLEPFVMFRASFGPPGGPDWARIWPQRPALEPRSIVQIWPMAARFVAKNCVQKHRTSRSSFSARCISAYSELRNNYFSITFR